MTPPGRRFLVFARESDTVCGIEFCVSAAVKTLPIMRRTQTGWLKTVTDEYGVDWRRPGHGGSHVYLHCRRRARDRIGSRETSD